MRGFWQGVAVGGLLMVAVATYFGSARRYPWESAAAGRRRRSVWRRATGRLQVLGRAIRP